MSEQNVLQKIKEKGLALKSKLNSLLPRSDRDRQSHVDHPTSQSTLEMNRRTFLTSLGVGSLSFLFGNFKDQYKQAFDILSVAAIKKDISESEKIQRAELLSMVIQGFGGFIENYTNEKTQYMFRPLDGFPIRDYSQQLTCIEQSIQYWDWKPQASDAVQDTQIGKRFAFQKNHDKDSEIGHESLHPGEILFLRTKFSSLGYDKLTEAFLVVPGRDEPQLFRLFGKIPFENSVNLSELKNKYKGEEISEAVVYNASKFAELQRASRIPKPKIPLFGEDVNTTPLEQPNYCQQYGMKDSWGNGQSSEGGPETTEEYAAFVLQRHKRYENLLSTERGDAVLNAYIDLTMVAGDTTSFFYANKIGEVEAVIKEVYRQFQESNKEEKVSRKIRFSFNIRVPGMWADKQSGARAGDMCYKFIEKFYTEGSLFSEELLKQFSFDWSIDPELPGVAARKADSTVRRLSTTDLANIESMVQHYSPESRVTVYDFGTNLSDNLLNEDNPYPHNVGYSFMGTLDLEKGVNRLTDEMIERKRDSVKYVLQGLYELGGSIPSDIGIMISDRVLNNNYIAQVNDGFMDSEILKKLIAPIEVAPGVLVRVNIVLQ